MRWESQVGVGRISEGQIWDEVVEAAIVRVSYRSDSFQELLCRLRSFWRVGNKA